MAASRSAAQRPLISHLAFGQHHAARPASFITDDMQLGVQAAFGAPDKTGKSPFLRRLAAVRCAFRWVESIMIRSGFSPSPASAVKIRSKTPKRLHRMKRL